MSYDDERPCSPYLQACDALKQGRESDGSLYVLILTESIHHGRVTFEASQENSRDRARPIFRPQLTNAQPISTLAHRDSAVCHLGEQSRHATSKSPEQLNSSEVNAGLRERSNGPLSQICDDPPLLDHVSHWHYVVDFTTAYHLVALPSS